MERSIRPTRERLNDLIIMWKKNLYLQADIFHYLASAPAPRFYITPRAAHTQCIKLADGSPPSRRVEMYIELLRRYNARREGGDTRSATSIFTELVNEPAPSFYLGADTIRDIILHHISYERHKKRQ